MNSAKNILKVEDISKNNNGNQYDKAYYTSRFSRDSPAFFTCPGQSIESPSF